MLDCINAKERVSAQIRYLTQQNPNIERTPVFNALVSGQYSISAKMQVQLLDSITERTKWHRNYSYLIIHPIALLLKKGYH